MARWAEDRSDRSLDSEGDPVVVVYLDDGYRRKTIQNYGPRACALVTTLIEGDPEGTDLQGLNISLCLRWWRGKERPFSAIVIRDLNTDLRIIPHHWRVLVSQAAPDV